MRSKKTAMLKSPMPGETLASCMNDEEEARNELTEHWGEYANDDKRACLGETTSDGMPS